MLRTLQSFGRSSPAIDSALPLIDRRAILLLIGIVTGYAACLLPVARNSLPAVLPNVRGLLILNSFVAAIVGLVVILARRARKSDVLIVPRDLAWYGAAALIGSVTIPAYGVFKQLVLPSRGFPLDPYLAATDRLLFFGHDGWTLTRGLASSSAATLGLDQLYSAAVIVMIFLPILIVALIPSAVGRGRLILCWLAGWIIVGTVAAWLLASAGPCYYDLLVAPNASFHALGVQLDRLQARAVAHHHLLGARTVQPLLLAAYRGGQYMPGAGISAAPSVHVTMATLFAIFGFQIGRSAGWIVTTAAVLIWIASIFFGWHYAIDGILGAAMMLAMWHGSAWVLGWAIRHSPPVPTAQPM